MKGHGAYGIIADNLNAVNPLLAAQTAQNRKKKLCWKCQKDKYITGGRLLIKPGFMLFVCKECEDVKAERLKEKNT